MPLKLRIGTQVKELTPIVVVKVVTTIALKSPIRFRITRTLKPTTDRRMSATIERPRTPVRPPWFYS